MTALRFFLASVVLAASLSGALILHRHGHYVSVPCAPNSGLLFCDAFVRPSWDDPIALAVLVLGVGVAGSVILVKRHSP